MWLSFFAIVTVFALMLAAAAIYLQRRGDNQPTRR